MKTKAPYIAEEAARLQAAYKARKAEDRSLNQEKVAEACGWAGQSAVSQYMTGKIALNLPALLSLSRVLRVAPESISPRLAETLDTTANSSVLSTALGKGLHLNTTEIGPAGRLLPVIGYVQVGAFCDAKDGFSEEEVQEWVEAGGASGPGSFIVRVEGKSMEPDFAPGDKVVIDPSMPWKSGDFVLASAPNEPAATLRQINIEGGTVYLFATNPALPDRVIKIDETWRIYGRARRKIVDL
ncbi:helix-turn-helix domain-containing protein [Pseudomonas huaxiensis]|uniref:helix-turn-helix domain-containing protein n=1 Tax=Pseudomonas huaxiensis TaxID=2213017 RepID=UPI000DA66595|nr:LexA family transcriptional regulator [Pseudomonas huaxiensis]